MKQSVRHIVFVFIIRARARACVCKIVKKF